MMKSVLMVTAVFAATVAGCAQTGSDDGDRAEDGEIGVVQSEEVSTATQLTRVGRQLFFDTSLSNPPGQACASCHLPGQSFTDPDSGYPTSEGAVSGRFGARNTPTISYAAFSPALSYSSTDGWNGGQFWDGRVDTLADQALQPFLNPIEMNNADAAEVVAKVQASAYAPLFLAAFGANAFDDVDAAFVNIGKALQRYEQQNIFFPFNSKYDQYAAGKATLTAAEANGLAIFSDTSRANCVGCHPIAPDADGSRAGMFTDFGYDNLGVPKNPNNPFYSEPSINPLGSAYNDRGLGATVNDTDFDGYFKAPTLRNLSRTGPYMHNGYFSTLKDVVHFYNTRDVPGAGWPAAEFPATMNTDDLGDLGLTNAEEDDLVAFLGTLSDAPSVLDPTCTPTKYWAAYNNETPAHELGLCGPAPEFLLEDAVYKCGAGHTVKYYSYSCSNMSDGNHTWVSYFACC